MSSFMFPTSSFSSFSSSLPPFFFSSPSSSSLSFSASVFPVALLTACIYAFYRFLVYPLYLSPLARIPSAHWSSAITPLWILHVRYKSRENETLLEVHRRLGPVVRLGPSDVSIDHIDHVKTVYGGGFDKTNWYSMFDNYGVPSMFSSILAREHAVRKRMISHVYSKSFIQSSPAVAGQTRAILLDRLLPILTASTATDQMPHGIDVFSLFLATSMDFIAAHVYGLRGGTDFLRRLAYRNHWLQLYLSRHGAPFFLQELPGLTRFLLWCRFSPYPQWVNWATEELSTWNQTLCQKTTAFLHEKEQSCGQRLKGASLYADNPEDEPIVMLSVLDGLRRENDANGPASIIYDTAIRRQDLSVQSELFDHILAGQETTGIALTYLTWRLSQNPQVQEDLRNELLQLNQDKDHQAPSLPDAKKLDALPILHAVIMETLRLHAPIAAPQPRQTPPAGCRIGPYKVPGGVRIAALAHTLHRNERIFPDPERWVHTRWLDLADPDRTDEARRERARQFWAFSSGGRMCIGSNFAMHEMKAVTGMIYSRFATHIVDDSDMEPTDSYTSRPSGEKLYLRFEPL